MSPRLRQAIIARDPAHPASSALRASDGSSNHACKLEAMRTQGFSVGELGMKLHSIAKAALTLSLLAAPCLAQAPRAAQDHFNRGSSLYQKGDFEGAIADFTKAIEISSRLDNRNWQGGAGFGGAATNFDKVRVLDPLAAAAYGNRALARYKLGDYEGAIADSDRAI